MTNLASASSRGRKHFLNQCKIKFYSHLDLRLFKDLYAVKFPENDFLPTSKFASLQSEFFNKGSQNALSIVLTDRPLIDLEIPQSQTRTIKCISREQKVGDIE